MKKSASPVVVVLLLILLVVLAGGVTMFVKRYTPTNTEMDGTEYYGLTGEEQTALVVDGQLLEEKGLLVDGRVYIDCTTVGTYINGRFYWDDREQKMIITLPEEAITFAPESTVYEQGGVEKQADEVLLRKIGEKDYLALDFIGQYTNMAWNIYEDPSRTVIRTDWENLQGVTALEDTKVRLKGGIKSPVLTEVPEGTRMYFREDLDDWYEVFTEDGYRGYVPSKTVSAPEKIQEEPVNVVPEYTSIRKDYPINLAWHQVTSAGANEMLDEVTAEMTGVNTISPTWFSIQSEDGTLSSLADASYVEKAHGKGLEVWALIDNFNKEVSTLEVLSSTPKRAYMIQQLMDSAAACGFDGINVDFESIKEEEAPHYIQFIRELSIACRRAGLVLSVDNPVPQPYNLYYDRKEQGIVADYVIIMGYDEHYVGSEAGSVASLPWVEQGIQDTLDEVPAERVINAIPFYTRLWKTTGGNVTSEAIGMDQAQQTIADNNVETYWDKTTSQNYGKYDIDNSTYQIWLEDAQSVAEKVKLVSKYDLAGVSAWKLGFENNGIWQVISDNLNN